MSSTVLSDEAVTVIGQLATIQSRKDELQNRINNLESRLNMTREASLALTNEEQELVNRLQSSGFNYGQQQQQMSVQPPQPESAVSPTSSQDQLAALLSQLFQNQAPTSNVVPPPVPQQSMVPTSGNSGFGSNVYSFPQPSTPLATPPQAPLPNVSQLAAAALQAPPVPRGGLGPISQSPTSASNGGRPSVKVFSPTSAPSLSIRSHRRN